MWMRAHVMLMVATIALAPPLTAAAAAQAGTRFGPITLSQPVTANGAALAPGTYTLRVTSESSDAERWVEFLSGERVAGRELATVIPTAEIRAVAKGRTARPGETRVEALRGDEYVRVWLNDRGTHYLLHLPHTRGPRAQ